MHGPTAPQAVAAAAPCSTCGFWIPLRGSLRTVFGVCANEWSPDDGLVVSADHGCGAHSQTDAPSTGSEWHVPDPLVDDLQVEIVTVEEDPQDAAAPEGTPDAAPPEPVQDAAEPEGAEPESAEPEGAAAEVIAPEQQDGDAAPPG